MARITPTLFIDPLSLGYAIQGVSILDAFLNAGKTRLIVETDPRLVPLFTRSYKTDAVRFIETDKNRREPLPNNGKPESVAELHRYFAINAGRLAIMTDTDEGAWTTLLRPEIAPPFGAFAPIQHVQIPDPRPGYLVPDFENEVPVWMNYFNQDDRVPVLVNWNKTASQHGDVAQQNLDADDIAFIIRDLNKTTRAKLAFYNAVDGLDVSHYVDVNRKLKGSGATLEAITDPKEGGLFDIRNQIDRYAALMSAAKSKGGMMIGVGNSYQHLWYAVHTNAAAPRIDQVVVLPHDHRTKATWELQERQPNTPTATVSKPENFFENRVLALTGIAAKIRIKLGL